jgi:hypothetical protein
MYAFMPKYQSLSFFVDDISGARTPDLFLIDDRRDDQCTGAQGDDLVGKMRIHIRKDRFGQPGPLQQVSKIEYGGLIWDPVVAEVDPGK